MLSLRLGFVVGLAITASACSQGPAVHSLPADLQDVDYSLVHSDSLEGSVLFEDDALEVATGIWVIGDRILLGAGTRDSTMAVVSRTTRRRLGFAGRSGEGPGELNVVWGVSTTATVPQDVVFYDFAQRRITFRPTSHLIADESSRTAKVFSLNGDVTVFALAALGAGRYVAAGLFQEGRVEFLDSSLTRIGFAGALPPHSTATPIAVVQHAYQSTLIVRPDRDRLALLHRNAGSFEILKAKADSGRWFDGPFPFEPTIRVAKGQRGPILSTDSTLRFGFVGGSATNSYIYALFSGHTRAGRPGEATNGEYVYVFDWDGKLVKALHLDLPASAIAVDPATRSLLAASNLPAAAIVEYRLPPGLEETSRQ